jgi:hypothetical protein
MPAAGDGEAAFSTNQDAACSRHRIVSSANQDAASDGGRIGSSASRKAEQQSWGAKNPPNKNASDENKIVAEADVKSAMKTVTDSLPVELCAGKITDTCIESFQRYSSIDSVSEEQQTTPGLDCDTALADSCCKAAHSCRPPRRQLRRSWSEKMIASPNGGHHAGKKNAEEEPCLIGTWLKTERHVTAALKTTEQQQQLRQHQLRRCDSEKLPPTAAAASSFSSPLYRGFLLRHTSRRSRDQQPGSSTAPGSSTTAPASWLLAASSTSPASHKHVLTPREVKNRSRRRTMVTSIHTIF